MILFQRLNMSQNYKSQEQNMQAIKSWADNLVDDLQMLQTQLDDANKRIKQLESEGK